jgi:uncharacterized integral membrane protein
MTAKTKTFLIVGVIVWILGFIVMMIPTATAVPFSGNVMIPIILGMLLIIAGVLVFARYYIKFVKERYAIQFKERRESMMGRKPVTAAMGWQAQAEYTKRLAAYSKEGASADERTQAKLFAQAVMTLTLMAPSTAVFSELDETAVAENDGTYTVTGWVDSQNMFGAMMRTPFSMTVFEQDGVWQTGR